MFESTLLTSNSSFQIVTWKDGWVRFANGFFEGFGFNNS